MRSALLLLFRLFLRAALTAAGAAALGLVVFAVVPPPLTAFMAQASVERGALVDYDWEPASRISPSLLVAVVAAEDQRFADHSGFDWTEIRNATRQRTRSGQLRGASTISQQVAKNLFLWPGHSWLRKGIEAVLTVMLETVWTKHRILEMYANVAEFGDGVFGAEAAARRFFGKAASALTPPECALLAASLPNPHDLRVAAPSPYMRRRQAAILKQMAAIGGERWLARIR